MEQRTDKWESLQSPIPSPHNPHNVYIINADPSALGLFGLAIVTLVSSSQKFGITISYSPMVLWAVFLGAFAQLFACVGESQRNNTFGTTAFGAFALFWFANALSWLVQMKVLGDKMAALFEERQLGFIFTGYLIFGIYMTFAATVMTRILFFIFLFVDLLFFSLILSSFEVQPWFFTKLAGASELLISAMSFYASAASVLNVTYGRVVLPVGKPLKT